MIMITLFPGTGGENEKSKTVKKPNNNKNKCQIYSGKTSEKKMRKISHHHVITIVQSITLIYNL